MKSEAVLKNYQLNIFLVRHGYSSIDARYVFLPKSLAKFYCYSIRVGGRESSNYIYKCFTILAHHIPT